MTITSTVTKVVYNTTDLVLIYAYTFRVDRATDFEIRLDGVLLTLTTDYSVDNLGVETGGNVTLVVNPGDDKALSIQRNTKIDQLVDYQAYGPFPSETHEGALDKGIMISQELAAGITELSYGVLITSDQDNLNVAGAAYVFCNTTENDIVINGLSGGEQNQLITFIKLTSANNLTINHDAGTGDQDLFTTDGAPLVIPLLGGASFLSRTLHWLAAYH